MSQQPMIDGTTGVGAVQREDEPAAQRQPTQQPQQTRTSSPRRTKSSLSNRGANSQPQTRIRGNLGRFMAAIRELESSGNYHVLGPQTRYGRPRGAYQILDSNWNAWAREAGIPGADWRDPAAQDRVAAYKMRQYFTQFGSWEAVAIAWFAGPGRARTFVERGINAVGGLKDVLGTSVAGYVNRVGQLMGQVDDTQVGHVLAGDVDVDSDQFGLQGQHPDMFAFEDPFRDPQEPDFRQLFAANISAIQRLTATDDLEPLGATQGAPEPALGPAPTQQTQEDDEEQPARPPSPGIEVT